MSSITLHTSTEISPIQIRRKQNRRRHLNPAVAAVILSCLLLLGRNHNFVGAVESPFESTTKSSTATTFLRKKTPFAIQRKSMSTRSGTRFRGGAAAEPADGNSEGNTPSSDASEPSIADAPVQATVPPAADSTTAVPTTADTSTSPTTAEKTKSSFSWKDARRTLFPIHGKDEVQKFFLIGAIKFFIIMALTLTRDTKDTLVVTQCGAEAIAFLKVSIHCSRICSFTGLLGIVRISPEPTNQVSDDIELGLKISYHIFFLAVSDLCQ